jgi:glucose-6-phosphate dehydrogenase assembly protein OpcA
VAELATGAWEAQDTTVEVVERELARILRELNRPPVDADGDGDGVVDYPPPRTSVLNLLVRAEDNAAAEHAASLVASLAVRTPSRTLQLFAAPDAESDGLDAAITTHCAIRADGPGHLCYEQVRLVARGSTALHLASVAEPLIVANLPVILWWLGRPPSQHDPLLDLSDRLVVDSDDFTDAPAGLSALESCTAAAEGGLELGDLGWRRASGWRQLIAQFFDPLDARRYQHQIRRVTIDYAATASRTLGAEPLLLVGWLASRLGWETDNVSTASGSLDGTFVPDRDATADKTAVTVHVRARQAPGTNPGELLAVTLDAGSARAGEADGATFEVRRHDSQPCAATRSVLHGVREVARTAPLDRPSTAELLVRELEATVADPIYAESLAMVARLVR